MDTKTTYSGQYKDEKQETGIEITNDFDKLSFALSGMHFMSSDLEEWQLDDNAEYTDQQLETFPLSSVTYKEGFNLVSKYNLTDSLLSISIPQRVLNKKTAEESLSILDVTIHLAREKNTIDLSVNIGDENIEIKDIVCFDTGLAKINKEIVKTHILFNCFNCRYSGYNIYGQNMFGSLLCYKKYKERFIAIKNKAEYLRVQEQGYEVVQETSYCEEFQLPDRDQFMYK